MIDYVVINIIICWFVCRFTKFDGMNYIDGMNYNWSADLLVE